MCWNVLNSLNLKCHEQSVDFKYFHKFKYKIDYFWRVILINLKIPRAYRHSGLYKFEMAVNTGT